MVLLTQCAVSIKLELGKPRTTIDEVQLFIRHEAEVSSMS